MRVWIDQDLCTGDGLCVDHCPDVFVQLEDGIAYVAEAGAALNDPGGSGSLAWVADRHVRTVIEAAEVCPGECIFIEIDGRPRRPSLLACPRSSRHGWTAAPELLLCR